jgi:GNAT superfamily N-acetyltransferase
VAAIPAPVEDSYFLRRIVLIMTIELAPRRYLPDDAVALTALLNDAYREWSDRGLNFTAATQDVETTRARTGEGACWVIEQGGELAATLTMSFPPASDVQQLTGVARVPGRAWLGQIAVRESLRGQNVARKLYDVACEWASQNGVTSVGLDTAVPAERLVSMYERWGFQREGTVRFPGKTYDSLVMVQPLGQHKDQSSGTKKSRSQ